MLYELHEQKAPYWFNNAEVARIQELNLDYMEQKDMAEMISTCFRKPMEDENAKIMNGKQMLEVMKKEYPSLTINHGARVSLGVAMKELGFEHREHSHVAFYKVIPLKASMKIPSGAFEMTERATDQSKSKAA